MIVFHNISLRNFMSFGNNTTIVNFDRPGTTLIIGEDLDNTSNGQGGNGVGKTSILNALVYALYDEPISKISKDNLVNNINGKDMVVTVEFTNNDGNNYRVERRRKTKSGAAGNTVHFFENGQDKTRDSKETNKLIEKAIGMPYELFVRIVVFSATHTPFLDLPVSAVSGTSQTAIIEELFGLTMISEKAALLKEVIKNTETSLKIHQTKVEHIEKEHIRMESQIDNARRRVEQWCLQNKQMINDLKSTLLRIAEVDVDQQRIVLHDLSKIDSIMSNDLSIQKQLEQSSKILNDQLAKNKKELIHLRDNKCPYCLQQYAGANNKIMELQQQVDEITTQIAEVNDELTYTKQSLKQTSDLYITTKQQLVVNNLEELLSIKNTNENAATKIAERENAINPFDEPLQELLNTKLEPIDYTEINKLSKDIEHQKFLLKLLTKKDSFIRKALLNNNIPYLNQQLQHYLTILGLPHVVEFTHQMTAKISQFGKELDFGNLSNGQRARVNIALSFAFKDVLQRLHTKINICMLDEILDTGLDAIGVQAAARLLKRKARDENISMYIISHRDEINSIFDNKITVQLSGGFSYIIDNINTGKEVV